MCTVWYVDKYINYISNSYQFQENLSRPSITDAKARYQAAARLLRNAVLLYSPLSPRGLFQTAQNAYR